MLAPGDALVGQPENGFDFVSFVQVPEETVEGESGVADDEPTHEPGLLLEAATEKSNVVRMRNHSHRHLISLSKTRHNCYLESFYPHFGL